MGRQAARLLALAATLAIAACSDPSDYGDPPSDDVLIAHFNQHRNGIEALAKFVRDLGHVGTVAMTHMDAAHALHQDPVNLKKLRAMIDDLGIKDVTLSFGGECLYLEMDRGADDGKFSSRNRVRLRHYKGFRQCDYLGHKVYRVEDTDLFIKGAKIDEVATGLRHLEDDWYLYHTASRG